jgi:hypothetical protein
MVTTSVGGTLPTLIENAKLNNQHGDVLEVVDTMAKATPVWANAYWDQSNQPLGEMTVRVVGRPTASVRRVNQAIDPSKATYSQVTEGVCEFASLSKIDDSVLTGFSNKMAARAELIMQHPLTLAEMVEESWIYGAASDGLGESDGFMAREHLAGIGSHCLDAGGTGGGSVYGSMLLTYWGPKTTKIIYPMGTLAGVQHKDFGLVLSPTEAGTAGAELPMWKDWFKAHCGLSIKNPLYQVRLANILRTDLVGVTGTQTLTSYTSNVVYLAAIAMQRIPLAKLGTPRWIMPRAFAEGLAIQYMATANANVWQRRDINGTQVDFLHGIPIDPSDVMGFTEAEVN